MAEQKRKGARTIKDIPKDVLEQLNRGEIECANLVEFLAIDRIALLKNILEKHDRMQYFLPVCKVVEKIENPTSISIAYTVAVGLGEQIYTNNDSVLLTKLSDEPSDFVRSWAAEITGSKSDLKIADALKKIKPFAADRHFNVRESAWAAVRHHIVQKPKDAIEILTKWAKDKDENVRRFASEATRPRGVWCEHIKELKENPELGLPILEPLKSDPSRYVQNSVANWLNDASKTQPEFVKKLCKRWEKESNTKETKYIIKRALRTLEKQSK
ncbi:MAG: HEAT repeat domain-containing protein [Bacteroidales bacterium]|nr:HEAT repeat domain-containing protein [Bacteroidales bacterium]